eukprot:scaffold4510_cov183-Amphora_coffeaeformis.AAC.31
MRSYGGNAKHSIAQEQLPVWSPVQSISGVLWDIRQPYIGWKRNACLLMSNMSRKHKQKMS